MDNRSPFTHKIHQWGHEVNGTLKRNGLGSLDWMPLVGTDFGRNPNKKEWSAEADDRRAKYHEEQYNKKTNK